MNQIRHVLKRENLYTLSLFALKLWLFIFKYILTWVSKARGCSRGLANARPPGRVKLAKAPNPRNWQGDKCPAVAREGDGRSWDWLMHNHYIEILLDFFLGSWVERIYIHSS